MWKNYGIRHDVEEYLTKAGIVITVSSFVLLCFEIGARSINSMAVGAVGLVFEQILFVAIVSALIYGNLAYMVSRLGAIRRHRHDPPDPLDRLEPFRDRKAPGVTVLVPAYKEEPEVVYQALLSVALMDYPTKQVVLLIDDPPEPTNPRDAACLEAMRALPGRLAALLARPRSMLQAELEVFRARAIEGDFDPAAELERVAQLYEYCAAWYESLAATCRRENHVARFFAKEVLGRPLRLHKERAARLRSWCATSDEAWNPARIEREYRRLLGFFTAEFTSFERKRYANLSHEANKAMNLNSYIAVMGKSVRETRGADGRLRIEVCDPDQTGAELSDADYIITLDADSMVLFDYALRLVHFMERPKNARVAIAQSPYSAFPEAPGELERVAGATTDIQHIVHQGFTRYNGTYWVGANALIRRAALDDIAVVDDTGGLQVIKYIQDRTVIEDTESTIDLMAKGWLLYNYPDRLAYSATPPDFGSLIIQRQRWSNGGLLVLPKLLRCVGMDPKDLLQSFVQIHYLLSPAATSIGVLLLIFYPFEDTTIRSLWLPMTALPYFYLYGRDLAQIGYGWLDVARVYSLNLILLPVQLGGVAKSLQQALTGRKTPFSRTPKVLFRTAAPKLYVGSALYLCVYCLYVGIVDLAYERWAHAGFTLVIGLLFAYAIITFISLRFALQDLTVGWLDSWWQPAGQPVGHPATVIVRRGSATHSLGSGSLAAVGRQRKLLGDAEV